MNPEKTQELCHKLKEHLKPFRYEHSVGVAYTAMAMAMRYDCDMDKAGVAGFLHDWAKQYDEAAIIKKCRKYEIPLTEDELLCPAVLHAKLGAFLAKKDFGIEDEEILDAIRYHTTGRPAMSMLEMILFVADYIEPNRDKAPNLPEIRALSFSNINQAAVRIMEDTIHYLTERNMPIYNMTLLAYSYYRKQEIE